MSSAPRFSNRHPQSIPAEMLDLQVCIAALAPENRHALDEAFDRAVDMVERRGKVLQLIQDALSEMRLDIRCLSFDLEVTRRERDQLRALLDNSQQD
jgi:hypothetical protein